MTMKTVNVLACGSTFGGPKCMGDLVEEGILTKEYIPRPYGSDIVWTNISADMIVVNSVDAPIYPGESATWVK
tara:strand:+ start:797 stop:1015 length:219 start_codon:yes stop_codon:yes gene_type:complete